MLRLCFALAISLLFVPFAHAEEAVASKGGMVVCVSPIAADVGAAILKKGGNAVDAAVAVGFAQAVTWPEAGNIGGGGFMLICPPNGKDATFIDYREMAPAAATKDMFAKKLDFKSINTVGVPGTVRGLALAHKKFGKLEWKEVVMPAVKLAEDGFKVNKALATSLNRGVQASANEEFKRVMGNTSKKRPWTTGDTLIQNDLGKVLRRIAEDGPDSFYTGETAKLIAAEMKESGGLITLEDLKKYEAKERKPLRGTYRGHDILSAPPPSSGGTTLIEMLNILENFEVKKNPWDSVETSHLLAETMKRAYADRARHLGDPDFVKIPEHLTTKEHAKKLAEGINLKKATPSADVAPDIKLKEESNETTHFSVIDKDGLAVSNTYTLENAFGCKIVLKGLGFVLNNEMTDFNPEPGVTTKTGRIGTDANLVAPGKRMLSSMTPTIVLKDGKVFLITGSPGGRTIINTVLCVTVNVIDYERDIRAAVDAPRLHHQWFPDSITFEDRPKLVELGAPLKEMGHALLTNRVSKQGDAHSILIDPKSGTRYGAADKRLDGKAAGE